MTINRPELILPKTAGVQDTYGIFADFETDIRDACMKVLPVYNIDT